MKRAYLRFSAEGSSLSAFRAALRTAGISCRLQQMRDGVFFAETRACRQRALSALAEEHGITLQILETHGLRYRLRPYRSRCGVLCGLLCGLAFLYWCNTTVRSIEITGNETVSDTEILNALAALGVERGTPISDIPFSYVEQQMRLRVSDIEWIALRHQGGRLIVDLSQERNPPEMDRSHMPANIIAAVPAQITNINVMGGHAVKQVGDTVSAGELLITGVQQDEESGVLRYYRAAGEVTGIYPAEFTCEQPFVAELPVRGTTYTEPVLEVFGKRFSLSLTFDTPKGDLLYEETRRPLSIFGHELPLTLIDRHFTEPAFALTAYSEEEARAILTEKAERYERNFHANDRIISRNAEFSQSDLGISLHINYVFEGAIGKSSEIFVKFS